MTARLRFGRSLRGVAASAIALSLSPCWASASPLPEAGLDAAMLEAFAAMVNEVRMQPRSCGRAGRFEAAGPVAYDARLAGASLAHVNDMIARDYFAHTGAASAQHPGGSTLVARVRASGYPWGVGLVGQGSAVEEVLARGHRSFREVLAGWLASPSHCAALMSPSMAQFGVAVKLRADSVPLWGMLLGRPPR